MRRMMKLMEGLNVAALALCAAVLCITGFSGCTVETSEDEPVYSFSVQNYPRTEYYYDEKPDLSSLKIGVFLEDKLVETISWPDERLNYILVSGSGDGRFLGDTDIFVEVQYGDKYRAFTFSFPVTVIALKEIVLAGNYQTEYEPGAALCLDGLEVIAEYDDGYQRSLSRDEWTASPQEGDILTFYSSEPLPVGIYYNSNWWYSSSFKVHAIDNTPPYIQSVRIGGNCNTTYGTGETLDLSGIELYALYSDGTERMLARDEWYSSPEEGEVLSWEGEHAVYFYDANTNNMFHKRLDEFSYTVLELSVNVYKYTYEFRFSHELENTVESYDYYYFDAESMQFEKKRVVITDGVVGESSEELFYKLVDEWKQLSIDVLLDGVVVDTIRMDDSDYVEFVIDDYSYAISAWITVKYNGQHSYIVLSERTHSVKGMRINDENCRHEYTYGDLLDLSGLEVYAKWDDGTELLLPPDNVKYWCNGRYFSYDAVTNVYGSSDVRIEWFYDYFRYETFFNISCNIPVEFEVVTPPKKTVYYYGDILDLADFQVIGKPANGYNERFFLSDCEITGLQPGVPLVQDGMFSVTVACYDSTETFDFPITVHEIKDVKVSSDYKNEYYYGDTLSLYSLKLTAVYDDGTERRLSSEEWKCSVKEGTALLESCSVTVSDIYAGNVWSKELPITVYGIKELSFSKKCQKDFYYGRNSVSLDLNVFGLQAVYDNGSTNVLPVEQLSSVPEAGTTLRIGSQTVELQYTAHGRTWSTNIDVTVHEVTEITASVSKYQYCCGEYLDIGGNPLRAKYDDGYSEYVYGWTSVPADRTRLMEKGPLVVTFSCNLSGRTWTTTKTMTVEPPAVISIAYNDSWHILFKKGEDWRKNCLGEERFTITYTDGSTKCGSEVGSARLYIGKNLITDAPVGIFNSLDDNVIAEGWYDDCYAVFDESGTKSEKFRMYVVPSNGIINGGSYVSLPTTQTWINATFGNSLKAVEIPPSVTEIKGNGFDNTSLLEFVLIPASVTSISDLAFEGCTNLAHIVVEAGNAKYRSEGDCLLEGTRLLVGCKNSHIPDSVTSIGAYAFRGSGIASVTIPDNVKDIEERAFCDCDNLTSIVIPDSVTSIGKDAFLNCSNLIQVEISSNIGTIGHGAFELCAKGMTVKMRRQLPPTFGTCCFSGSNATLLVPSGSKEEYDKALSLSSSHGVLSVVEY